MSLFLVGKSDVGPFPYESALFFGRNIVLDSCSESPLDVFAKIHGKELLSMQMKNHLPCDDNPMKLKVESAYKHHPNH